VESLQDALDQLEEARDVALMRSAKYQQTLRRYDSRNVRGWAFKVGDVVGHSRWETLCSNTCN
jgi:hypothetical protein